MSNEGDNKIRSFVFIPESVESITGVYYFSLPENTTIIERIQEVAGGFISNTGSLPRYVLPADFIKSYKTTDEFIEIILNYKIAMVYTTLHYKDVTIINLIQHADVRINGIEYHPEYFNVFLQNLTNDKSKLIFTDKIIIYNKNKLCKRTENSLEPVEQFTRIYNEYTYLIDNEIYTFINNDNFYYPIGSMKIHYKEGRQQMLQFRKGLFNITDFMDNFNTAIMSWYYNNEHGGLTNYDIHFKIEITDNKIIVTNLRSNNNAWHNDFTITVKLPFYFLHNFPYYLDTSQEIIYYNVIEFDKYTPEYTTITIGNEQQMFILPEENQNVSEIIPLNFIGYIESYTENTVTLTEKVNYTTNTIDCIENNHTIFCEGFDSCTLSIKKQRTIETKYTQVTENVYYYNKSLYMDNHNKFIHVNNIDYPLENSFVSYYNFIHTVFPRTLKRLGLSLHFDNYNNFKAVDDNTKATVTYEITIDNYYLKSLPGTITTDYNNVSTFTSGIITKDSALTFTVPEINYNVTELIRLFVPGVKSITDTSVTFNQPVAFIYEKSKSSLCFSKYFYCFNYQLNSPVFSTVQSFKEPVNYFTENLSNYSLPMGKYTPEEFFKLAYYYTNDTTELPETFFNESEMILETSEKLPEINNFAFNSLFTEIDGIIHCNLQKYNDSFIINGTTFNFPDQFMTLYDKTVYVSKQFKALGYNVTKISTGLIHVITNTPIEFTCNDIQLFDHSFAFYFMLDNDTSIIYRTQRIYSTYYALNKDELNEYFKVIYKLTDNSWELVDIDLHITKFTIYNTGITTYFNLPIRFIYSQRHCPDYIPGSEYSGYQMIHFTENLNGNNNFNTNVIYYIWPFRAAVTGDNEYSFGHYGGYGNYGYYRNDSKYNYNEYSDCAISIEDKSSGVNKLIATTNSFDFIIETKTESIPIVFPTFNGNIYKTLELFDLLIAERNVTTDFNYGKLSLSSDNNFRIITESPGFLLAIIKYFNKFSKTFVGDIFESYEYTLNINGNNISIPKKRWIYSSDIGYFYLNTLGTITHADTIYYRDHKIHLKFNEPVKVNYSTSAINTDKDLFTITKYNETTDLIVLEQPDNSKNYLINDNKLIQIDSSQESLIIYNNKLHAKTGNWYLTKEQTAEFISGCFAACEFNAPELTYTMEKTFTPPPYIISNWFCKNINDTNTFQIDSKYYVTTNEIRCKLIENDELSDTIIFTESLGIDYNISELIPSNYGIECSERFHEYTVIDNKLIKVPKSTPEFTEINGQLTDGSELISEINSENNEIKIMYSSQEFIVPLPLGYYNNSELTEILGTYISLAINKEIDAVAHGRMLKINGSIEFIETNSIDYFMFIDSKLFSVSGNDYYQLGRIRFNEKTYVLPFITEDTYAGYFEFYDNDSEINLKESLGCSFSTWEFINPPVIAIEITENKVKFNNPIMLYLSTSSNYKITDYIQCKNNRDYKEHVKYFNDNNRKYFLYFRGIEHSNNSFQFIQRDIYADRIFYSEYFYYNKSVECIIDPDKNLIVPAFDSNGNQLVHLNKVNDYEFIYNNEYYYRINSNNNIINISSFNTTNGDFKLINSITNETYTLYKLASILSYPYASNTNGINFICKNHDYYYINNYKLTNYYQFTFARDNNNLFKPGHTYSELMFKIIETPALTLFENIPRNVYGYIIQWPRKHIHCISSNCNQIRINDEIREIIPGAYIEPQIELVKQLNINITKGDIIINNNISFDNLEYPLTNQYYFSKFSKSKQPFVTINNTNNVIKYIIRTAFDGKPGRNTSIEKTFTVYLPHGNYYNHVELFTEIFNCTSKTGYPIIFDKYSETKFSARINFNNYADFMLFKVPNGIDNIPLFKNLFFYNYPVNTNYNVFTQTKTMKLFPIHSHYYFCTTDTIILNIPDRSGIGYGTQIAMVSKNNEGLFYKEYDLISINFETLVNEIFANVSISKVNENKFIVDTTDILAISLPSNIIKLFNINSDNLSDDYTLFSMYNNVSANRSSYDITAKTFMITENRLLINYCNNVFTFVEFSE